MSIALLLQRSAALHAHRPALAFGGEVRASYTQFFENASCLARGLRENLNVRPGDRVAFYCANHPNYLEALWAAWIAGAAAVPVNAKLHAEEAAWILQDSGASVCWADADKMEALAAHGVRLLDVADDAAVASLRGATALPVEPRGPHELAWLFYTSGTTGRPKGVMLSHENLLAATQTFLADVHPARTGDVLLHAAPISHGSGLYNFAYVAQGGLNMVAPSRGFDEEEVLDLAAKWPRRLSLFAAPTMVKRMVAAERARPGRGQHLDTVVYGGGPMYVADIQDAIAACGQKFVQIYGQGESPMTITVLHRAVLEDAAHPRHLERIASVGVPHLGVEVAVRGADGTDLPAGETGEICMRGRTVMRGYWNNPAASADALKDGWLQTGDLGALDADGFLTLKDRSKDLVISGGSNIYPREVEEVLLRHSGVSETAVIGVPDAEWGEAVVAFVVPASNETDQAALWAELDALCLSSIARFKRPKRYIAVDGLPKNNYGKVLKTALRTQHATDTKAL